MGQLPHKLLKKLDQRQAANAMRILSGRRGQVDFTSNDYLGLSGSTLLYERTHALVQQYASPELNGSGGSRLLGGNHPLYEKAEAFLCDQFGAHAALIFNSGYDANIGFFSSVPQRGDIVLYDELIHASIRDGIRLGNARNFRFRHNDMADLKTLLVKFVNADATVYVVTESVFSMDGDSPDIKAMVDLCKEHNALLVVDEAHALGVVGPEGKGLCMPREMRSGIFARIMTFGKAPGVHGAAILGSEQLKQFLVNFCRSLIYTTALPPHSVAAIIASLETMNEPEIRLPLLKNLDFFQEEVTRHNLRPYFKMGNSAIACMLIPGNSAVKAAAVMLKENGYDVRPVLSPTVTEGEERLRICIHSYNSFEEIEGLLNLLSTFVKSPSKR